MKGFAVMTRVSFGWFVGSMVGGACPTKKKVGSAHPKKHGGLTRNMIIGT